MGADSGNMEYVKKPFRIATTPTAQRVYISTFLFAVTSAVLLFLAAAVYPIFYYKYVPKKVVSIPIHLQYNAGLNPFGVSSLKKDLMLETAYDVTVTLTLPRSPANVDRGNFMVALFATKASLENPAQSFTIPEDPYKHVSPSNVVFSSRRPALMPYTDPLVSLAGRVLFLAWHVVAPASDRVELRIPMGELVQFREQLPLSLLLDVQAGQTFQAYATSVELVARLTGIRWLMYNHRILGFIVGTTFFWLAEMLWLGLAWLALAFCFGRGGQSKDIVRTEKDVDTEGYDYKPMLKQESEEDNYMTAATSRDAKGKSLLKDEDDEDYDRKLIKEESVERDLPSKQPGYGGDDEAEGTGSSYGKGKATPRKRLSGERY
ncbi:putative adipose-regulatory protein-domain-containing protein [Pestalotiopsis sp. NC0098]|nr:putative adipose-regulatory protein-domain-containing protein [Pestalotiopsis sp. NC0098]